MTVTEPASPAGTLWFVHWLRALSVAFVVLVHLWVTLWANNDVSSAFAHVTPLSHTGDVGWAFVFDYMPVHVGVGYVAVGFFFLISGFLIPLTMEGKSTGRFAVVRIFRVYPVWIASTALFAIFFAVQARTTGRPAGLSVEDWLTNAAVVPDLTGSVLINPVGWTLMIEVKFYLLCAVLAGTTVLRRPAPIAGLVILWTGYAVATWDHLDGLRASHPTVWIATQALASDAKSICLIFAGVCLYNRLRNDWTLSATTGVIAVCFASMVMCAWQVEREAGYVVPKSTGYAAAVILFALAYSQRHRFPKSRAVAFGADLSYSLYATHFIFGVAFAHWLVGVTASPAVATVGAILFVLAVSTAMNRWIEVPGNRFGKRVRWPLPRRAGRATDQASN